ncbi:MAG TPA: 30S ribosome-binding factor RbfA [Terriglobales bacterium]|nr:30S ribosome-binding factor RbfA [Terriglobales bacterium]
MPHRPERLAESIRDELTEMIEGELADPRIGLAAISEISLDPHLRVAHIFVAVAGDEAEQRRSLAGLLAARGFLRSELGSRLQLRHVPELRFELDRSEQHTARLEQLLNRARKRAAAHPFPQEN